MIARILSAAGRVMVVLGLVLAMVSSTSAQAVATNFDQLQFKVKKGDTLFITDQSGREAPVSLVEISKNVLLVQQGTERREFTESQVRQIRQRLPDPLWTGAAIGAGIFLALGALAAGLSGDCGGECAGMILFDGALGAGVGVGIDALVKGRKVIYAAPSTASRVTVVPMISRTTTGCAVKVSF